MELFAKADLESSASELRAMGCEAILEFINESTNLTQKLHSALASFKHELGKRVALQFYRLSEHLALSRQQKAINLYLAKKKALKILGTPPPYPPPPCRLPCPGTATSHPTPPEPGAEPAYCLPRVKGGGIQLKRWYRHEEKGNLVHLPISAPPGLETIPVPQPCGPPSFKDIPPGLEEYRDYEGPEVQYEDGELRGSVKAGLDWEEEMDRANVMTFFINVGGNMAANTSSLTDIAASSRFFQEHSKIPHF